MAQVRWTEPALDDLRSVVEFAARDSPAYAARLAQKIVEAPRRLTTLPRSGARVPEFDREDLRELAVRPFRILGSRDLSSLVDPDHLPEG